MTKDEALKMALDAMLNFPSDISDEMFEAITAIKKVLAQPKTENIGSLGMPVNVPVTPPQRTWVGLTDEDWDEIFGNALTIGEAIKVTEAKLKEKNNA